MSVCVCETRYIIKQETDAYHFLSSEQESVFLRVTARQGAQLSKVEVFKSSGLHLFDRDQL